jgi:integrase
MSSRHFTYPVVVLLYSLCGLLSADLAAGIRRVNGVKKLGVRLGNWLTAEQGQRLRQAPDMQRLKGKRDRALLALLLACGLRRHEAVTLTLDHLRQREDHWAIVDLVGKAGHVRRTCGSMEVWCEAAGPWAPFLHPQAGNLTRVNIIS